MALLSASSCPTSRPMSMMTFDDDAIVPCNAEKNVLESCSSLEPATTNLQGLGIFSPIMSLLRVRSMSRRGTHAHGPIDSSKATPRPTLDTSPRASFNLGRQLSTEISDADAQNLWQDMLALQQQYNCYRSARMQVAAGSDLGTDMMPSRACMDLLNASLHELPEEGWRVLEKYWASPGTGGRSRRTWRFWQSS